MRLDEFIRSKNIIVLHDRQYIDTLPLADEFITALEKQNLAPETEVQPFESLSSFTFRVGESVHRIGPLSVSSHTVHGNQEIFQHSRPSIAGVYQPESATQSTLSNGIVITHEIMPFEANIGEISAEEIAATIREIAMQGGEGKFYLVADIQKANFIRKGTKCQVLDGNAVTTINTNLLTLPDIPYVLRPIREQIFGKNVTHREFTTDEQHIIATALEEAAQALNDQVARSHKDMESPPREMTQDAKNKGAFESFVERLLGRK